MMWMPYQGWSDITEVDSVADVNVTYYKTSQPLTMHGAWRANNPKSTHRPYCVIARMGYEVRYLLRTVNFILLLDFM